MIIIPTKWLFHWEYTLFSDKPILTSKFCDVFHIGCAEDFHAALEAKDPAAAAGSVSQLPDFLDEMGWYGFVWKWCTPPIMPFNCDNED